MPRAPIIKMVKIKEIYTDFLVQPYFAHFAPEWLENLELFYNKKTGLTGFLVDFWYMSSEEYKISKVLDNTKGNNSTIIIPK